MTTDKPSTNQIVRFNYRAIKNRSGIIWIVDAHYDAADKVVAIGEVVELDGPDLEFAREDLLKMLQALDKPLLDGPLEWWFETDQHETT